MKEPLKYSRFSSRFGDGIKASSFTGHADFNEALYFIQDVQVAARQASTVEMKPKDSSMVNARIPWQSKGQLSETLGFALSELQYTKLKDTLNATAEFMHIPAVHSFLTTFTTIASSEEGAGADLMSKISLQSTQKLGHIDQLGRAVCTGGRKTASARVIVVPNDNGLFYVNGMPAASYFTRCQDMFRLAEPMSIAQSFGKYNVWATVEGSGRSSQAQAVAQALAKALVLFNPDLYDAMMDHGEQIVRDPRKVERKKCGKPKARKSFTWVKR